MPKKNQALVLNVGLQSNADPSIHKVNPTIAAGDFQVSKDGASFANLATLPVVTPAGSSTVLISLSATEMNADTVVVNCLDAAGAEWASLKITMNTDTVDIDDVALTTALTTAQNDLDVITGSDGATLATAQGNYAPNVVVPDAAGVLPTAAENADAIWDEAKGDHVASNSFGQVANYILADTGTLMPATLAKIPKSDGSVSWNATAMAAIQTEANAALVVQKLDHLVAVADSDDPVNNSIMAKLAASDGDWSGFSAATDALEAIRDQGDAAWVTGNTTTPPTAIAIRQEMDSNSTQLAAIVLDTDTTIPATIAALPTAIENADALLIRAVANVEDTADKHSLGAVVMISTNASITATTLTAKKPSDDSTFFTYTVTVDASADPITGVS